MKPENDFRRLSKTWLRVDGYDHYILATLGVFIAGQATFWSAWLARNGEWHISVLIAAISTVFWSCAYKNARYAAKCLRAADK